MDTRVLLAGLIGFFIGGLLVSVAATASNAQSHGDMSMNQMAKDLEGKSGDEFDKAFITGMIVHHQGALDMARKAEHQAKHEEVRQLSRDIMQAQKSEIDRMQQWQADWGYTDVNTGHAGH